ncbi:MAG TPA: 2-phospho-L-lactate transferase CofD family protein, partial [Actinomycetota bacterium]
LSAVTAALAARFGVGARILPVTDDRVETRIRCVDTGTGEPLDLHFQEYWVRRRAADPVKEVRYAGAATARPAPGVLDAIASADAVVLCPSNPVVSIGPILAVPGVREAVAARRDRAVGVSGIVAGAPVAGMADKLMPAAGIEMSAAGVAAAYADIVSAWLVHEADAALLPRVEALGIRSAATDTIMVDDERAETVARIALRLLG